MPLTKAQQRKINQHLAKLGKWDDYDARRSELRENGMSRYDALQKAAEEFLGDLDKFFGENKGTLKAEKVEKSERKDSTSLMEDAMWVYNNLDVKDVKAEDAPSSGAWGWLQKVRGSAVLLQDFFIATTLKAL